jgi:hypothetical protein
MCDHSPIGDLSPDLVAGPRLVELASGVDSMYLSGWADLPDGLLDRLEVAQERARAADSVVGVRFGGIGFGLAPFGLRKYRYRLSHEHLTLGITPSSHLPPIRIQPRAEFLHGLGLESAIDAINYLLETEVGHHRLSVSRVDLFSDWQGWSPSFRDDVRFVSRARHLAADKDGAHWTGFRFGRRSSGGMVARVYDKTAEIAVKGAAWWFDRWRERYVPDQPVIRVEVEFHRRALAREFGLDTPEDVVGNLGGLWAHATEAWLTHRDPTQDSTRSRWPLSAAWQTIQHPSFRGEAIGLERATRAKTEAKLSDILPVLRGCFTSASAQWGADSIDDGIGCLTAYFHEWELETGQTIHREIATKRQHKEWGL